jgi:hypothetical protein
MKLFYTVLIQMIFVFSLFAQEEKEVQYPVYETFANDMLAETQTIMSPAAKHFNFIIHHRMGKIKEIKDLFGIYAPSDIRLGIDYGITDKLMLGFGIEKNNYQQELRWKYAIFTQTKSNSMPVSVSYFGNIVLDAIHKDNYGAEYKFISKLSYFNQIIIARKFNEKFSFEVAAGYSHFNMVDSIYQNDAISLTAGGTYKFTDYMSVLFEYNHSLYLKDQRYFTQEPTPGVALGFQVGTPTHAFQLFASTYNNITPQTNYVKNSNQLFNLDVRDPLTGAVIDGEKADLGIRIGFNITVRF